MAGALSSLKIVEVGEMVSAPYCSKLLADMGAEVVKIERPQILEMRRPNLRPQCGAVGSIVADNHEQHRISPSEENRRNEPVLISTASQLPQNRDV